MPPSTSTIGYETLIRFAIVTRMMIATNTTMSAVTTDLAPAVHAQSRCARVSHQRAAAPTATSNTCPLIPVVIVRSGVEAPGGKTTTLPLLELSTNYFRRRAIRRARTLNRSA